jgi:hypothetical protein
MKRRNFLKNTGLGLAGLTLSKDIFANSIGQKTQLNIVILLSGGVNYNDIITLNSQNYSCFFQADFQGTFSCKTNIRYYGEMLEHAPALIQSLDAIDEISQKKILITNKSTETTESLIKSKLPLDLVLTNAANVMAPYATDLGIFEKANEYLNTKIPLTLILNLEDTDVAHYNAEKYYQVLSFYDTQIKNLCAQLFQDKREINNHTSITVASVLGRNNFGNEINYQINNWCSDHFHDSARQLFAITMKNSEQKIREFDHREYDSRALCALSNQILS